MVGDEGVTARVEDIGHLHGGPTHDAIGLRKRRDWRTTPGRSIRSCSNGFGSRVSSRRRMPVVYKSTMASRIISGQSGELAVRTRVAAAASNWPTWRSVKIWGRIT
jgi:anti-sigma factor RsiW